MCLSDEKSLNINRRGFLKTAGMGAAAMALTGLTGNTEAAIASSLEKKVGAAEKKTTKVIDLEAHFHSNEYLKYLKSKGMENSKHSTASMLDVGAARIEAMDKAGVDIQVLNAGPPDIQQMDAEEGTKWARIINDELSEIIKEHPNRYAGFASIAPQDPEKAAEELDRAVTKLGLKGVCLKSHAQGNYLDDKKYRSIFQVAEKYDVPIFLHPAPPSEDMLKAYSGYNGALEGPVWGFAADTSLHVMRLIMSGLFDEYPNLKIILGHMGEGLPFWLSRIDFFSKRGGGQTPGLKKNPSEYILSNFTVGISGMCYGPAFSCAFMGMGADHIAFATDYPHEDSAETIEFIKGLHISPGDREKIFHSNAEKLLHLS